MGNHGMVRMVLGVLVRKLTNGIPGSRFRKIAPTIQNPGKDAKEGGLQ